MSEHLTKICSLCKESKEIHNFGIRKASPDGRHYYCFECRRKKDKTYYSANPEKFREIKKQEYLKNPEKFKERRKKYTFLNKEESLARLKQWALDNPERAREGRLKAGRKYSSNNPHKVAAKSSRRRAKKKIAIPSWDINNDQAKIDENNMFLLASKLSELTGNQWSVDHMCPITGKTKKGSIHVVCGLHTIANFDLLLKAQNSSKNSFSWPSMWDYNSESEIKELIKLLEHAS